ncbi:hypothetical protein C0Q70_14185 [Pomacea canaliculata]|uniref:BTB domain-containing protein n=1 Tax=Pomacea canaliculata TaxID=400727 RepID=A0A2T7NZB8_POMCA|nr:kelch-like protein 28 [Pomacea canaliculata]XP_025104925.1 kelch-like protein 28 [Pomacea canaliculata]PVD26508.1 hypothetical protein C0Q70_14185 [Pomacea canaliculata]
MEKMAFEYEDHQLVLLEELKAMFDEHLLIDVYICVGENQIPCHRNVLSAASPYFRAMFTSSLTESRQMRVELHEVDAASVSLLINYAYTGKVDVTRSNAQSLLATASLLQMLPVQRACAKFMEMQLDINNCIGIHAFAHAHSCPELSIKAREFIEKNFTQVSHTDEFLELSATQILDLLASDELNVEKEEVVWEALLSWVTHSSEIRRQHIGDLLAKVRLPLLPARFVQDVIAPNNLIQRSLTCRGILSDMRDFERNPQSYTGDYDFSISLRSGMIKPEHCILLVGGLSQSRASINCYNPLTRETFLMATFPECEDRSGYYCVEDPAVVVADETNVYAAGGNYIYHENYGDSPSDEDSFDDFDEEESVRKDFFFYDNDHNKWIAKAPMLFPKSNFTLAYEDGKIFSFGGLTLNQHPTEIVECFDVEKNKWSYVGMMPTTLVDLSSVVYGGNIFLLGGRTGVAVHNVVLKYDPRRLEWTPLAGMPTPRFSFGVCIVDNEILVAGGQVYAHATHTIHREALRSVEIYNIDDNQWRTGPDLPAPMFNVGLMQISGGVYCCGTVEQHRSPFRIYRHNMVCRLDITRNEWQKIESDLCDVRNYAAVAVKLHTRRLSQVFRPEVDT